MQRTKAYSGSVTLGSMTARNVIYGYTTTFNTYHSRTDLLNSTIAAFLQECGVDAAYEARGTDTNKWLWIYNVPFLFVNNGSGTAYTYVYTPFATNYWLYGTGTPFSAVAGNAYSFSLIFTGSADSGFALRIKMYNSTAVNTVVQLRIFPCTNIANGRDAVVWLGSNNAAATGVCYNANGCDIVDGFPASDSTSATNIGSFCMASLCRDTMRKSCCGKFPLIPIYVGVWQAKGLYRFLSDFDIPAAAGYGVEAQTELSIAGRKFINTVAETPASSYLNMGLIEVTGT